MSFFRIPSHLCRLLMVSIMLLAMLVCSMPISHTHSVSAGGDHHHQHDDVADAQDVDDHDDPDELPAHQHFSLNEQNPGFLPFLTTNFYRTHYVMRWALSHISQPCQTLAYTFERPPRANSFV